MNRYVLLGLFWFLVGHIAVFFQLNGQFKWEWFKENTFLLALFGIPISYFYIWGTKYAVEGFDGLLWPARFLGFGVGMVVYAIMVAKFFNEGTQNQQILQNYWGNGKSFTTEDLTDDLDIMSPGARLTELREAGFDVRVVESNSNDSVGRPVATYKIMKRRVFA